MRTHTPERTMSLTIRVLAPRRRVNDARHKDMPIVPRAGTAAITAIAVAEAPACTRRSDTKGRVTPVASPMTEIPAMAPASARNVAAPGDATGAGVGLKSGGMGLRVCDAQRAGGADARGEYNQLI